MKRRLIFAAAVVLSTILVLVKKPLSYSSSQQKKGRSTCINRKPVILVDTRAHELLMCDMGIGSKVYSIRIGRGGSGKARQGDNKTPLGIYSVGAPRQSRKFGIFIPIGYPTEKQKKAGFSGGDVGIHGPHRLLRWAGSLNSVFDTSEGCVGVSSDQEIKEIADWVSRHMPLEVHIE